MKKINTAACRFLLAIVMWVISPFKLSAYGYGYIEDERDHKILYDLTSSENLEVAVSALHNDIDTLIIPSYISVLVNPSHYWSEAYTVTSIRRIEYLGIWYDEDGNGYSGYRYPESLTSVTIPATVTNIVDKVFSGCNLLNEIKVDPNNRKFGDIDGVLYDKGKNALLVVPAYRAEYSIPEIITEIGNYAFYNCGRLGKVDIPNTVVSIGDGAFSGCKSLTSILLPSSIAAIGKGVFDRCDNLKKIYVAPDNNNFTDINGVLFNKDKTALKFYPKGAGTEYTIPNTVTSIDEGAFSDFSDLISVTLPSSLCTIGDYAFSNCHSLTSITIPDGVTEIGNYAFKGCSSLTSIVLPPSVTNIGDYAFSGCESLVSVVVPEGTTEIGKYAFSECGSLTSVTIPSTTLAIHDGAFYGCSSLATITIPDGVKKIGDWAFYDCSSLLSVEIPSQVTHIGDGAFADCSSLTSVNIPAGVTEIMDYSFMGCRSLTEVVIPDGVEIIRKQAFRNCNSLTEVTIPESVEYIGTDAFSGCKSLTTIRCKRLYPPEGMYAFYNGPVNVDVYVPKGSAQYYKAYGWCDFSNFHEVDDWVNGICDVAMDLSAELKDIYTPQGICIKNNATQADIDALSAGLYIIGGKKVYKK